MSYKSYRDLSEEVTSEDLKTSVLGDWIRQRVERIHQSITAVDVLKRFGVRVKYETKEEQISCPFHGKDAKPSARIYPARGDKRSHVWCYVCQEQWDAISLWRKFQQSDCRFTVSLAEIEKAFGIPVAERPDLPSDTPRGNEKLERLFAACEARLLAARDVFQARSYLTLCVLLDRLYAASETGEDTESIEIGLQKILDKIGEKCRAN